MSKFNSTLDTKGGAIVPYKNQWTVKVREMSELLNF